VGASVADGTKALRAWAAQVNARGGLAGHPVNLIVADDGSDPARHQALVQQLVEERGVIAFVYNSAPLSGQASVKYLTDKRVPVIGSELAGQWFYESPMFFPQASSGLALVYNSIAGVAAHVVPQGKTKWPSSTARRRSTAPTPTGSGRRSPGSSGSRSSPGPGVAGPAGLLGRVSRGEERRRPGAHHGHGLQQRRAGGGVVRPGRLHPVFSWASTVTLDRHKDDPNLEGSVIPVPLEPWFLANKPVVKEFQDALARYAAGVLPSGSSENGWWPGSCSRRRRRGSPGSRPPTPCWPACGASGATT